MKFLLVIVFVFSGHTYHEKVPYATMNECTAAKQLTKDKFKQGDKGKLLSVTCQAAPH